MLFDLLSALWRIVVYVVRIDRGIGGLKIAVAGGYFRKGASAETREAMARVARALETDREIEFPETERARAAAYVITATEGAALSSLSVKDRLRDLLAYSVSEQYFTVRRHLGLHVRGEVKA